MLEKKEKRNKKKQKEKQKETKRNKKWKNYVTHWGMDGSTVRVSVVEQNIEQLSLVGECFGYSSSEMLIITLYDLYILLVYPNC